jgi:electron transfer flavoprotein alpha subunit
MGSNIFVIAEHLDGAFTDATFELLALGRELAADTGGVVEAGLVGSGVAGLAGELGGADTIVVVDDDALGPFNPDTHAGVFSALVAERDPQIVLVPYTSIGMDVASHIAEAADLPLVSYCKAVSASGSLKATSSLYAGKLDAEVEVDGDRAVFAVLSGAASAEAGRSGGAGSVETAALSLDPSASRIEFLGLAQPEAGDVDITTQEVLVVVGRGIGDEDSIEEAQEVADALGGAIAASRPIVDQGWLPKTRQVGKSGLSVKPKVYLALGVSGAPEHVEGMRDSSTIIAVNTDPAAPIFGVAHYGWVGDLFDILPELTDRLEG